MVSMSILFVIAMIDFGLTYYGINVLGVITEGNPVLIWLFNLPLHWAALMRIVLMMATPFIPLYLLYKYKSKWFKRVLILAYGIFSVILFLHARWIVLHIMA